MFVILLQTFIIYKNKIIVCKNKKVFFSIIPNFFNKISVDLLYLHWIWLDNIKHTAYFFRNIYFDCYFSTESQGKPTRKSVKKKNKHELRW